MSDMLNKIDELRKRASVSYADAKEALEYAQGDLLEAMVYLEKHNRIGTSHARYNGRGFFDKMVELWDKGNRTRCIVYKKDRTIFNLSLNMVVIVGIVALPFIELAALGILVALFTGHRFRIEKNTGEGLPVNETLDRMSDAVDQIKGKFTTATEKQNQEM